MLRNKGHPDEITPSPTLANNGGPTLTHALVPGSPALNAGTSGCPPPTTDQRGLPGRKAHGVVFQIYW